MSQLCNRIYQLFFIMACLPCAYAQEVNQVIPAPPTQIQSPAPTATYAAPVSQPIYQAPAPIPAQTITPPNTTAVLNQQAVSPPPVPATRSTSEQQMAVNKFEQWLQSNGYQQGNAQSAAATPPPINKIILPPRRVMHPRMPRPLSYEEGQRIMRNSVPPNSPRADADSTAAFNEMMKRNIPMTPREIVQMHQEIDQVQRAAAITPNIPPKPVSSTIMVNLAPGTTPPAIRLAQGYVTSLVFVDSTGAPWPIAVFDIGNPKAVNIQWDGKGNILMMQAVSPYSDGDIVVRLVGLPTPITLEIVSGQRVVDYRADIHVSGIGPNSKDVPLGTALPNNANQLLLGVLDGVAPSGSKQLTVQGADCQAWLLGDKMFFRSRLTVLSPGWMGKMVSPDGMMAYELPKTSSVLISRYGEPIELKVEGF